jgi:hypothetical protein
MKQGIWSKNNPKQLALEFYAPFYLLVSISDTTPDKKEAAKLLAAHIERFIEKNSAPGCAVIAAIESGDLSSEH